MKETRAFRFLPLLAIPLVAWVCAAHSEDDEPVMSLSMVHLIVAPQTFVDRRVSLTGYLNMQANLLLFLTKDHASVSDYASSITVGSPDNFDVFDSPCVDSYVNIQGKVFEVAGPGIVLGDISKIVHAESNVVCWTAEDSAQTER